MRHRRGRKPPGTATPSAYRHRASRRLYPPPANNPLVTRSPRPSHPGPFAITVSRASPVSRARRSAPSPDRRMPGAPPGPRPSRPRAVFRRLGRLRDTFCLRAGRGSPPPRRPSTAARTRRWRPWRSSPIWPARPCSRTTVCWTSPALVGDTRQAGAELLRAHLAIAAASAVNPLERNVVISPAHPHFVPGAIHYPNSTSHASRTGWIAARTPVPSSKIAEVSNPERTTVSV